jgi:tetratricopeptide (TPR) repeat protein
MEKAFQVNSDNKVVLSELIGMYDELGQSDAGLATLQSIYDEKPENTTVAMGIGQMLKEQNRPNEAIPYWEKVAENHQSEQSEIANMELGELYHKTGQWDKSLNSFQQAANKVQQKYDDGFYAHDDEMGREELVNAQLNVVKVLISQGRQREAQELLQDKVKNLYNGNLADLTKRMESSNNYYGYRQ